MSETTSPATGTKHDQEKPRYELVQWRAFARYVDVVTFGAKKYSPGNWALVANYRMRYLAAALRHIVAYMRGVVYDEETGLPNLAHAVCCLMFVLERDEGGPDPVLTDAPFADPAGREVRP